MLNFFGKITLLLAVLFISITTYAFEEEGDTTSSKIQFNNLEATLSARIIHFRWSVESEEDGDHFLIQKSLDQENWSAVTKVSSIKSHKEQHTYEISEIDFAEGVNEFFRIVRVDANGEATEIDRVNVPIRRLISILASRYKHVSSCDARERRQFGFQFLFR